MKLFESAQKTFKILGICSNQRSLNGTAIIFFLMFLSLISFYVVFLVNIAHTFKDYTDNIYLTASTALITFGFVVFVFKKKIMFELIDRLEKFIDASK